MTKAKTTVVTGAGRGIGRAVTNRLVRDGWTVYATARTPNHLDELGRITGVVPIRLDITDEDAVASLADELPESLDALVNNAGFAAMGPLETITADELSRQLATNVVGHHSVTRALLPKLRGGDDAEPGRIVFISSLSGLFAIPGSGAYTASKYALEGLADTLRLELRPWAIPVCLIEPGTTRTDIWTEMKDDFDTTVASWTDHERALYREQTRKMIKLIPLLQRSAIHPDRVANAVARALSARHPRRRYLCDPASRIQVRATTLTPPAISDFILTRLFTGA